MKYALSGSRGTTEKLGPTLDRRPWGQGLTPYARTAGMAGATLSLVGLIMAHKNVDKEGGHRRQDPQEVYTMASQKWAPMSCQPVMKV